MGAFSRDVRFSKIPGPTLRKFDRELWLKTADDNSLDEEDKNLLAGGLYFDQLLTSLRDQFSFEAVPLSSAAITRLLIATGTSNLVATREELKFKPDTSVTEPMLNVAALLSQKVQSTSGVLFGPDELITGYGDGLKFALRELLEKPKEGPDAAKANERHLEAINAQMNVAILYNVTAHYWADFVGHLYRIELVEGNTVIRAGDEDREIARIVSIYRRRNIHTQFLASLNEFWMAARAEVNRRIRQVPVVDRTFGSETVERIELGWSKDALDLSVIAVAEVMKVSHGYYGKLLDEPLAGLSNFTLREVMNAWLMIESLAHQLFESMKPVETFDIRSLLRYAPLIPARVLTATISRALGMKTDRAEGLLAVLTFNGASNQELWSQPLVRVADSFCIMIPCIVAVHFERVVELWMRQGGMDLERKGPDFEAWCLAELRGEIDSSPLKEVTSILGTVEHRPPKERAEEIDVVIVIGSAVLLIELKCILWPDDPLQFANYRETISSAAAQIKRKQESVVRNYPAFRQRLKELGITAPEKATVTTAVMTNSPVYSGFPVDGVPVIDILILKAYFKNRHITSEIRAGGKSVEQNVIHFYDGFAEAEANLDGYLMSPPQIANPKKSIQSRDIEFPLKHRDLGKLTHKTFEVQVQSLQILADAREAATARSNGATPA